MGNIEISVKKRIPGKKYAKLSRKNNEIPFEIYGKKMESNISGSIDRKEFIKAIHGPKGRNVVFDLKMENSSFSAIPLNFQIHPVKDRIDHIDFLAVNEGDKVKIKVPVEKIGKSKGEIAGGILIQTIKELPVICSPENIPEKIVVDATEANIGDRIKISQLNMPEGVKPVARYDVPVIVINKGRGTTVESISSEEEGETSE